MEAIILDNVKGSELAGKLKTLEPEKRYTISIQPEESRSVILAELKKATIEQQPDPAVVGKSENGILVMVNEIIGKYRARHPQSQNT